MRFKNPWPFILLFSLSLLAVFFFGFERLTSDIATRIRYGLRNAALGLQASSETVKTVALRPNTWPDGCPDSYEVFFSPYKGDKQVPAADIRVTCQTGAPIGPARA